MFLATLSQELTSCTEPNSTLVEFVEDNTLSTPNDTLNSLMGIIGKMQQIADRTVILGEIRGDLTTLTANATLDLQDVANFSISSESPYNDARDYYAVIQNCNYYLSRVDTSFTKRGEKIFIKEYAAIKSYRAWTYLQLALNYGSVPFYTAPILTELEANPALYPKYDIAQMADFFIKDLEPFVDTDYPSYGTIGGVNSRYFYIPVRVLLGDFCLWAGRYKEAASYYHDYLTKTSDPHPVYTSAVTWENNKFQKTLDGYASQFSASGVNASQTITVIPMEESEYNGTISYLKDIFNSTEDNNYYYQATHSAAYDQLSQSQRYTMVYFDPVTNLPDTIVASDTISYASDQMRGDLRQQSVFTLRNEVSNSSAYASVRQTVQKHRSNHVCIYRLHHIYLRYAEALNRAGYPNCAFAVLKYGLNSYSMENFLPAEEVKAAGKLVAFSEYDFTRENTAGIHSRGCGDVHADNTYAIPEGLTPEQQTLFVEDKICDEMALETAAEGLRFYDLMRISMHRNDPTFLAGKVARRNGTLDQTLFSKLSDMKNWYMVLE